MSRFLLPIAGIAVAGSACLPLHAQLLIDAGGPRDAFYSSGGTADGLDGLHAKFDTAPKDVELTYLGKPMTWLGIPDLMLGATLKASAIDGLPQFFRFERWPKTDLSLIANKTWTKAIDDSHAWAWSLTTRVNGGYADCAVFDPSRPSGQEFRKTSAALGEFIETLSVAIPWIPAGVALSAGVREASNYQDLPSTTVGGETRRPPVGWPRRVRLPRESLPPPRVKSSVGKSSEVNPQHQLYTARGIVQG